MKLRETAVLYVSSRNKCKRGREGRGSPKRWATAARAPRIDRAMDVAARMMNEWMENFLNLVNLNLDMSTGLCVTPCRPSRSPVACCGPYGGLVNEVGRYRCKVGLGRNGSK